MNISEIQAVPKLELKDSITFICSRETKETLVSIANAKGKRLSELVREIVDGCLTQNQDEIKKLVG